MKYQRKNQGGFKHVEIQAVQISKGMVVPDWLEEARNIADVTLGGISTLTRDEPYCIIYGYTNDRIAYKGDFVYRDIYGTISKCTEEQFNECYEKVKNE